MIFQSVKFITKLPEFSGRKIKGYKNEIGILVYHDVLDDRLQAILIDLEIDSYTKWENATGKFQNAEPLLGSRTFPGYESVRLVPFREEKVIDYLAKRLEEFNSKAVKPTDEIRMFLLPLEKIV